MATWSTEDTIHLMVFHDDGGYCAIIHAPNPRLPVRFSIAQDSLQELKAAIEIAEAGSLLTGLVNPEADRDDQQAQTMQELCGQIYNLS